MSGLLAAASIGSSLLGGLFGRSNAKRQAALQREFAQKGLGWRVEDARAHGLHGLVGATGQSAQYQPVNHSPMADAASDIANTLGNEAMARRDAKERAPINAKQEQLVDAQIAEARSRTLLNHANAKRSLVGPGSSVDPYAMRTENALIKVKLENGETVMIPNPDVYEIGPTELVTGRGIIEGARVVERARGNPNNPKRRESPHPPAFKKRRTQSGANKTTGSIRW